MNFMKFALVVVAVQLTILGGVPLAEARLIKGPISLSEVIESARLMSRHDGRVIYPSPDGAQYVALKVSGDVTRDGVRMTVLAGNLRSLEGAAPRSVVELFTSALGGGSSGDGAVTAVLSGSNVPLWLDNSRIALRWPDERDVQQVLVVNLRDGHTRFMTEHDTDVFQFGLNANGTIVYAARTERSLSQSNRLRESGFAVASRDASVLVAGFFDVDRWSTVSRSYDWFVRDPDAPASRRVDFGVGEASRTRTPHRRIPSFAPDGRFAIVGATPAEFRAEWRGYSGDVGSPRAGMARILAGKREDPTAWKREVEVPFVVDLASATAKPLWNTPWDWFAPPFPQTVSWSPDSQRIVLVRTYLPEHDKGAGGTSGAAVAEVDVRSGRHWRLPLREEHGSRPIEAEYLDNQTVAVRYANGQRELFVKRKGKSWIRQNPQGRVQEPQQTVNVELREDMNTPPALFALDAARGDEKEILVLNPQLKSRQLAHVEMIALVAPNGEQWQGRLYLPAQYDSKVQYPLVVQLGARADASTFSLHGNGFDLGPPQSATAMAEVLAERGILVLQVGIPPGGAPTESNSIKGSRIRVAAYIAAIQQLADRNLVDRNKVGIQGFSHMAWDVTVSAAEPDFEFAAAVAQDGIDGSYYQAAWSANWLDADGYVGAPGFGAGLEAWLERAPAFKAERIRSPLLLISQSLSGADAPWAEYWELFSRLRALEHPVELFVGPRSDRGNHNLQNPHQVLGIAQRTLDWWLFWLKGEEDADGAKSEQYASWRQLKSQHEAAMRDTRPPRLDWTAKPANDGSRP